MKRYIMDCRFHFFYVPSIMYHVPKVYYTICSIIYNTIVDSILVLYNALKDLKINCSTYVNFLFAIFAVDVNEVGL